MSAPASPQVRGADDQLRAKRIPGAKLGRRWLIPTAAITALEERALQGGDQ